MLQFRQYSKSIGVAGVNLCKAMEIVIISKNMLNKTKLVFVGILLAIPIWMSAQNRFVQPSTSTYTPLSPSEIMAPAMIMRQRHDAMAENINNMVKYINSLKSQTNERVFLSAMDSYLTRLRNMSNTLEERGVNAVSQNSLSQIYDGVQDEINKYNARIEQQKQVQNQLTNHIAAASNAMDNHRYSVAIENFTKAINLVPDNPDNKEYYRIRGLCYLWGVSNPYEAASDFIRYGNLCENNSMEQAQAFYLTGIANEMNNNLSNAVNYYSRCINIDNSFLDAYYRRGIVKSGLNDRIGAIADYDYIINYTGAAKQGFKDMATVYNNKSYCLVELGEYDKALPLVEKALEIDKSIGYIWDTRGEIFYHKKDYRKCISDMDKAIELAEKTNYESANSFYYRGLAKIQLAQKTNGCRDLSKANELGHPKADESISKYCK